MHYYFHVKCMRKSMLLSFFFFSTGTTNTPEYYINMRTGIHYFPRGVNGVAAVERSRQKFGLNKIDETVGETIITNHRRTESCDLGRRQPPLLNGNMESTSGSSSAAAVEGKETFNYVSNRGLSPDLQRRLTYQNYKGFECKLKSIHIFNE